MRSPSGKRALPRAHLLREIASKSTAGQASGRFLSVRRPPFSCTRARARRRRIDAIRADGRQSGQLAPAADQPGLLPQHLRGLEGASARALHDFPGSCRRRRLATVRARRCGRRRGARPCAWRVARSDGRQRAATRASRPRTTVVADDLRLMVRRGSRGPGTRCWLAWVLVACPVCVWTRVVSLI